jgi:hypothetical protein
METFRGDETIERSESFVSFRFMDPVLRYAEARDENGSDTDGYHWYRICFRIYVRIRIRIRIV